MVNKFPYSFLIGSAVIEPVLHQTSAIYDVAIYRLLEEAIIFSLTEDYDEPTNSKRNIL